MGKRREAREAALQMLFGRDINPELETGDDAAFWSLRPADPAVRRFGSEIAAGIFANIDAIDARITGATRNYQLNRISTVDRNILRMAIYEMLFRDDIPPVVSINEAIELAKEFGTEDSGRFVNGILDKIKDELDRPLREARREVE